MRVCWLNAIALSLLSLLALLVHKYEADFNEFKSPLEFDHIYRVYISITRVREREREERETETERERERERERLHF